MDEDCNKEQVSKSDDKWTLNLFSLKSELGEVHAMHSVFGSFDESESVDGSVDDLSEEGKGSELSARVGRRGGGRGRGRSGSAGRNETQEERVARLARMSAYASNRLAGETPEARAHRLKRMSEYAARRLARESDEQRARRLARMSAYAARRLAQESPEQRQNRLTRMSAYAAKRHAMKKNSKVNDTIKSENPGSSNVNSAAS